MNIHGKLKIFVVLASAMISVVQAEDVTKKGWSLTPYFWLPSMDVTSTIPGLPPADIDLGFDEIFDSFDVFAISARGEYWWGQFGLVADGMWMDMDTDSLNGTPVGLTISDGILDMLAGYRFNLPDGGVNAPSLRLLAGGRYHYFKQEASAASTFGGSRDWLEPVVGGQLIAPFGEKWLITVRGDAGGFGIGNASDLTWSAMFGGGYHFAENWKALLGYRYYYIDYSDGSGADKFGMEGSMQGPWIGISYRK